METGKGTTPRPAQTDPGTPTYIQRAEKPSVPFSGARHAYLRFRREAPRRGRSFFCRPAPSHRGRPAGTPLGRGYAAYNPTDSPHWSAEAAFLRNGCRPHFRQGLRKPDAHSEYNRSLLPASHSPYRTHTAFHSPRMHSRSKRRFCQNPHRSQRAFPDIASAADPG